MQTRAIREAEAMSEVYTWEGYYVFKENKEFCLTNDPKDSKRICEVMNEAEK